MLLYFLIINLAAFSAMGIDKHHARHHQQRIPEKALFALALSGGALGGWLGTIFFRHKTKHWYFVWGFPAIFVVETALAIWIKFRFYS